MAFNSSSNNGSNNNGSKKITDESDSTKEKDLKIYVEADSQAQIDELFQKALNNELPLHIPYRMRKFPESFFKPPASGSKSPSVSVSHSRENSADSAFGSGTTVLGAPTSVNGLPIHHSRAHSSPASLGPASLGKINIGGIAGLNTNCAIGGNNNVVSGATGGAAGVNVKPSFLNNNNSSFPNTSNTQSNNRIFQIAHSRGRSYDVSNHLPAGWEQARTDDGRIYYIDHNNKKTQWDDPRLNPEYHPSLNLQPNFNTLFNANLSSAASSTTDCSQGASTTASTETLKPNSNPPPISNQPNNLPSANVLPSALGPLPEGWEEGITCNGERYYINHKERCTTWKDPRLTQHDFNAQAAHEQSVRLHNLQIERERLRKRQLEIKNHLQIEDPFLTGSIDSHTRQESGDSGLSVSSMSQSMAHTPDFLSTIDDSMDGLRVSDNTMDTIPFNTDTPDEFMLDDPLLLEKFDPDSVDKLGPF